MREIRALVADDEPLARRRVGQLLLDHGDVVVIGEASDGRETKDLIARLHPDLLFLDIQMPQLSGLDALVPPPPSAPVVVFLTAHAQFASRAFDIHAADYLLKPIGAERFAVCMERVRERLRLRAERDAETGDRTGSLLVPTRQGLRLVLPEQVDWIEATDYYVTLHLEGGSCLLRESLASLEGRLPDGLFLRIHRSALVNVTRMRFVSLVPGRSVVVLADGTELPVSRRRRAAVRRHLRLNREDRP